MSATAQVVEGKMEPVQPAPVVRPIVVTGQYFYDQFVNNDGSGTRMAWIRTYLVPNADPIQVKGALDECVKIAHQRDIAAGVPEKERGPKRNTAMNVRTFVCAIYGALKFAPDCMAAMGFDETTGWLEARNMAKPALERANKVWTGHDIPSKTDREQKKLQQARKEETDAFLEATKATPRALNESFASWQSRIAAVAEKAVAGAQAEKLAEQAQKAFEYLTGKYDRNVLGKVTEMLLEYVTEANNGQSDMSEEEANALLASHTEPIDNEHIEA